MNQAIIYFESMILSDFSDDVMDLLSHTDWRDLIGVTMTVQKWDTAGERGRLLKRDGMLIIRLQETKCSQQ